MSKKPTFRKMSTVEQREQIMSDCRDVNEAARQGEQMKQDENLKECPLGTYRYGDISKAYYWIAINGGSCAASGVVPLALTGVSPRPGCLIGFPSEKEALDTQQYCLTAPNEDLPAMFTVLRDREDLIYIVCKNPEPPTREQTMWFGT